MDMKKAMRDLDWQIDYLKSDYAQELIRNSQKNKEKKEEEEKDEES